MPTATPDDVRLYVPNTPLDDPNLTQYLERAERDLQRAYEATGDDYDTVPDSLQTDVEAVQTAIILLSIPGDDRSTDSVSLGDWQKTYSESALAEMKTDRDQLLPDDVANELKGNRNTSRHVTTTHTEETTEGAES